VLATGAQSAGRQILVAFVAAVLLALAGAPATALAAPNDQFVSAQVLTGNSATASANNGDATKEAGEPNHAGNVGGHSVWWRWTAPTNAAVVIDTCDSTFDTLLAVYTGDDVSALAGVASNDEDCESGFGQSRVTFTATAGQTYAIAVDGKNDETGDVRLRLQPALNVTATVVKRKNAVDATKFTIEFAAGDSFDEPPPLKLTRNGKTQTIDLDLDGERINDHTFTFTFTWSCDRHGAWTWSASVAGATQTGSFVVPKCDHRRWYVSSSKAKSRFASFFGKESARRLQCSPVGKRKGSKAAKWRCRMVKPGFVCTGSFFYRFQITFQGGEVVARTVNDSGRITCHN
jgi:hypothetical protein